MALQLLPLEPQDATIFYKIVNQADADSVFARNLWPDGVTEAGQAHSAAAAVADMQESNTCHRFMKVIDPNYPDNDPLNKIISVAQWKVYPFERSPQEIQAEHDHDKARGFPPGCNPAFLKDVFGQFGATKEELIGNQAHIHLRMLFTRPEGSRRGAGAMHLAWGMAEADRLGVPTYLEASPVGRPLYERVGFETKRWLTLDETKWKLEPDDKVACMIRPAKAKPATSDV